jgi:hypothetical protein
MLCNHDAMRTHSINALQGVELLECAGLLHAQCVVLTSTVDKYYVGVKLIIIMLQPVLHWFPSHLSGCAICGQSPKITSCDTASTMSLPGGNTSFGVKVSSVNMPPRSQNPASAMTTPPNC